MMVYSIKGGFIMKFLLSLFVLFLAGFSYSQTFRPVGSNVDRVISVCIEWAAPEELKANECVKYQACSLLPYTDEEPIVVACLCHVKHSSLHPKYSPQNTTFPYKNFNGVHMDQNVAEEEARESCLDEINGIIGNQNPDHWISSIECGVRYRYVCADGSVEMRNYF